LGVHNIVRINEDDKIKIKIIDLRKEEIIFSVKNAEIRLSDIDFYGKSAKRIQTVF